MKLSKKLILALITVLISGVLSGCNNAQASKEDTKGNDNSKVEESVEATVEEENQNEPKVDLLAEITPKLKTLEGIESVKKDVKDKFKEILSKNNFPITSETPNNMFVISELPYNKYTKDYNQSLYSLVAENYTDGTIELKINASKDIHKEDLQVETDDFIKCMYDLYTFVTKETISLQDFVAKINEAIKNGTNLLEMENYNTIHYVHIAVKDTDASTKTIVFDAHAIVNETLKRKYYTKEYETVSDYQTDTENIRKGLKEITKKYYTGVGNAEANLHGISDATIMTGKNRFLQSGAVNMLGGMVTGAKEIPKFEENEVNELVNIYKLVLGEEQFNKANQNTLTVENLNKLVESQIILNTYARKYDLPEKVDAYIDNAKIEFSLCGNLLEENDESIWVFASDQRIANIYMVYSVPVKAEGITSL